MEQKEKESIDPITFLASKMDAKTAFKLEKEIEQARDIYHKKIESSLILGIVYKECGIKEIQTFNELEQLAHKITLNSKEHLLCECDIYSPTFELENGDIYCCRCERKVDIED